MKTNHSRAFVGDGKRRPKRERLVKEASDTNRRAAERQGLDRIKAGADPDAATMPSRNAEAGDPWDFD